MTRLAIPPPTATRCIHCGSPFRDGPLLEWHLCSEACANANRDERFDPATNAPRDAAEIRRQRVREERLQRAMVERYAARQLGVDVGDTSWLELAEADLGHYSGGDITRRIGELVDLYGARRPSEGGQLSPEQVRSLLWAMVPRGVTR